MNDQEQPGLLDRAVELLASALDSLGFNGTRLRWKWKQRRLALGETGARASVLWRSARARHKMCPNCRALVPRLARKCPECGAGLAGVRAPGLGRLLSNVFPGATATTSLIMFVNGLLFLMMLLNSLGGEQGAGLGSLIWRFDGHVILRYGSANAFLAFQDGEWWRLVSAMFLHGGLIHFGFNSYVLLQLGPLVEAEFGTERFWVIYLLSGLIGNVTHVFVSGGSVVGASGAICGLVGLLIAFGSRVRTTTGRSLKSEMIRFSILIAIISILPGISWQAHLGGFLTGLGLGWVVPTGQFRSRGTETLWQVLSLAGVTLALFCFYQVALHGTDYLRHLR